MRIFRRLSLTLVLLLTAAFAVADQPQLRQLGMVEIPGQPGIDQMAFARGMLIITHPGASAVDIFDPTRRRVVAQIKGLQSPEAIAVDEQGGTVYVADAGANSIAIISIDGWRVTGSIPLRTTPGAIRLTQDAKSLYVADPESGMVSLLDLATHQIANEVKVDGTPRYFAFAPGRQLLYVSVQDRNEIVAIDSQMKIVNRFSVNGSQPTGLVYDGAEHRLYVAVRGAVLALNAETGVEVNHVDASPGVDTLWLDSDTNTLYAAGNGSLQVLRTAGGQLAELDKLSPQVRGHTLAYDANHKLLFVPGGREGRTKMLIMRPMNQGEPALQQRTEEAATH